MIAEAHEEMEDSHWMTSLSAAFSAWKQLLPMPAGACHTWTMYSLLRTSKPASPSSIPPLTEPSVKMWTFAGGWWQGADARGFSAGMATFSCRLV